MYFVFLLQIRFPTILTKYCPIPKEGNPRFRSNLKYQSFLCMIATYENSCVMAQWAKLIHSRRAFLTANANNKYFIDYTYSIFLVI